MNETARLILAVDSTDVSRADQALLGLGAQADRVERQTTRASDQIAGGFKVIGAAMAAVAGSAALRKIVGDLASFDQAMRGVQAVSGATAAEMAVLEKQARELGATSMFSAQQAADAQRFLAQAGFEVNEVLGATPGILQLAAASGMDLGSAADLASNALSGFRLEVSELSRVNDVLAATAASANTDVMQLGQALSFAAPIATAAGVSIEETSAAIGALSDAGLQASRAGTGFVGFIRQLSNVTPQAAEALDKYHVSVSEVDISTRGLQPVIDRLAEANISTADAFQIFGSEAGAAAQILLGASGRVQELTDRLGDAEGAASRMAGILGEGLTGSLKGFGSAAAEATLQLGDGGMGGAMQTVVDTATGVLNAFNGLLPVMVDNEKITQDQADTYEFLADAIAFLSTVVGTRLVASLGASAVAKAADTVESLKNAKAQAAVAESQAVAANQTVRRAAAELSAAKVIQARALADAKATAGTNAHAIAMDHLAVSATRVAAAEAAYTTATNAAAAASTRAAAAAKSASVALTLLGGPIGAVATALAAVGYAVYAFTEDQRNARQEVEEFRKSLDQAVPSLDSLIEKYREVNEVQREGLRIEWVHQQEVAARAAETAFIEMLNSVASETKGWGEVIKTIAADGPVRGVMELRSEFQDLTAPLKEAYENGENLLPVIERIGEQEGLTDKQVDALKKFAVEIDSAQQKGEHFEELLNRISGINPNFDYSRSSEIANEIIGELNEEVESRERATKAANDQFKSIQRRVEALQLEAETLGMTATQAELYRLRIEGATEAQLNDAEAALRARDAYNDQIAAMERRNEAARYANEILAEMESGRKEDVDEGEKLLERYMTEEELLQESHDRRLEILEAARAADYDNQARWDEAIRTEKQAHEEALNKLELKSWQDRFQFANTYLGMLSGLMSSENRKMFEIGKAAALANAIVSTYAGAANALDDLPFPANIAAAAAVTVAGMARVHA
ncbi:phage tail tape measure protein, partial [Alcanivoracaceae bacterium MT1]